MEIHGNEKTLELLVYDSGHKVFYLKCFNVIHYEVAKKILIDIKNGVREYDNTFLKPLKES